MHPLPHHDFRQVQQHLDSSYTPGRLTSSRGAAVAIPRFLALASGRLRFRGLFALRLELLELGPIGLDRLGQVSQGGEDVADNLLRITVGTGTDILRRLL